MKSLWLIFRSQLVTLTVLVINIEALMLFFVGLFWLAVPYALAGAAIAWTFGTSPERD